MDKFIDSLGDATAFCTPYANSSYWQEELFNGDRDKTAFAFHHEPFSSILTPLGLNRIQDVPTHDGH